MRVLQMVTGNKNADNPKNPPVGSFYIDGKYYNSTFNVYLYVEQQQKMLDMGGDGPR